MAGAILDRAEDVDGDRKLTSEELLSVAKTAFNEFGKKKVGKLDEDEFVEMLTAVFPAPKGGPLPGPLKDKK